MAAFALCLGGEAIAQTAEWQPMTGAEIEDALDDKTLIYEGSTQVFKKSGRTLFDNGRPSWGYWAVRGDQYCSQWPPSDGWACYDMERHESGARLKFVSDTGYETIGRYGE